MECDQPVSYMRFMPNQIVIHLIKIVIMWINTLPHQNWVSTVTSPREIVSQKFSANVKAIMDEVVTNTLRDRTKECIALEQRTRRGGAEGIYPVGGRQMMLPSMKKKK